MDIRQITHENVPCWYELAWVGESPDGPAIVVAVHPELLEQGLFKLQHRGIPHLQQKLKLPEFQNDEPAYGYGGVMKWGQREDGFKTLTLALPEIETDGGPCRYCNGTGKHPERDDTCISCRGKGKERSIDWTKAFALSASLTILFGHLRIPSVYPESDRCQLMNVETTTSEGPGGSSLGGDFGIRLVSWLVSLPRNTKITEMIDAMMVAHTRTLGRSDLYSRLDFEATATEHGWLNISCPGDRCSLNPGFSDFSHDVARAGRGYRFYDHNIDNPMQQLILLAGLASLHGKARAEGVL